MKRSVRSYQLPHGERSPHPHSFPARSLDSVRLLATEDLAAALVMNEPGWWVHERVILPARTRTHRLEREVKRGCDPDSLIWPDCKRPHDYYW
jgi:hypothetical protein